MRFLITYAIGLIFGFGIILGGMANPAKVLRSIVGVCYARCIGRCGVGISVRSARRMADVFHLPTFRSIDAPLIAGSTTFGVGWGIARFCLGEELPAVGKLDPAALTFTGAIITGIVIATIVKSKSQPLGHTV
jgi:uncharacterized membrane protein YedE/YeeE